MRRNKTEYACETLEVSNSGVVIVSDVRLEIGETVIAYLDLLGGVEAKVSRKVAGGYVLTINTTPRRRSKIASQVDELMVRLAGPGSRLRRHRRVVSNLSLNVDLGCGPSLVRCLNISVSGALLEHEHCPPIGLDVVVGGRKARVVRHEPRGFAVAFDEPLASLDQAPQLAHIPAV